MKINKIVEKSSIKCTRCNRELVEGTCPTCSNVLVEGPISFFKNRAANKHQANILAKDQSAEAVNWKYIINGEVLDRKAALKCTEEERANALVYDGDTNYWIRRGLEDLSKKAIPVRKDKDGKIVNGEIRDDAKYRSTEKKSKSNDAPALTGHYTEWVYELNDEDKTHKPYHELPEVDGKVDLKDVAFIIDKKGKRMSIDEARAILDAAVEKDAKDEADKQAAFDAQQAAAAKKKAADADVQAAADMQKKLDDAAPKIGRKTKVEFHAADDDAKVDLTVKAYKKLSPNDKRQYTVHIGDKKFTYDQILKIRKLKTALNASYERPTRYDDTLMESFTPAKSFMDYDDDFTGPQTDINYQFDGNIDDDFG